ncbi:MarR family winged helix-turn-helix transcriptional regulator [Mycolicibacterium sediminis]|uniref:Putative transcriptional regulator, MarR family protein n=1 Tax=Mycolicibacterium sediminis TaxID=1286180 RepID=A0A7I7QIK0_9MYCO|nr:MarR family winged helix-turn-helix transcriptional regulator [Mycolicibacterium sediminis]BBY25950.1 putative transcriptional regulator, MarR family protein [Mycolicibacterium sediminis]
MKTKSALIADINALLGAVKDKFEDDEDGDAERDYMIERCPPRLRESLRTLPTLALHLLAHLEGDPTGVVGLAARSGQLKGTVSKQVQRLVEAGLVMRTPVPGNRKEVELALTDDGELVARAHDDMHVEMAAGVGDFLSRYAKADLEVLATVLSDLLAARRVGVRLTPPTAASESVPLRGSAR